MIVWQIEQWVTTVVFLGTLLLGIFALVDAVVRPAAAYEATGRLSKQGWVLILVLAVLVTVLFESSRSLMGLFGLVSVIASGVYLADVRPAIIEITRR